MILRQLTWTQHGFLMILGFFGSYPVLEACVKSFSNIRWQSLPEKLWKNIGTKLDCFCFTIISHLQWPAPLYFPIRWSRSLTLRNYVRESPSVSRLSSKSSSQSQHSSASWNDSSSWGFFLILSFFGSNYMHLFLVSTFHLQTILHTGLLYRSVNNIDFQMVQLENVLLQLEFV